MINKNIQNTSKSSKVYVVIGIPVALFMLLTVFLGIEAATYGTQLSQLEKKAKELEGQNRELSLDLVETTSLSKMSEKTAEMGFVKPTNIVYITTERPVAQLPQ